MQIVQGTCDVTYNSPKVVASTADIDWSDALVALQQGVPVLFALTGVDPATGDNVPRSVVAVQSSATSSSGKWELTLVSEWLGATQTGVTYILHKDFTLNYGLALPTAGEQNWAQLLARNMAVIDANLGGGGAGVSTTSPPALVSVGAGKSLVVFPQLDCPVDTYIDVAADGGVECG